eukprot:gb/GFBE01071220.1/.p1 GENE.gb/GFBE01071220.1/~~gb/GFBE01071220.1/.p1  ORF type:complete len:126 (+),score=25.18 gb/GFBE01071220.1/:1-378(+)
MPSARGCISEYVHRIGRTGSAGKKGFALTFLEEVDLRYAREIYDMLEASGQTVPSWLKEAASNWKRYKNMFLQKKRDAERAAWEAHQQAAEAEKAKTRPPSRADEFLAKVREAYPSITLPLPRYN